MNPQRERPGDAVPVPAVSEKMWRPIVMTVATEKPMGQVMTWAGVGPGLGLTGVTRESQWAKS
jgi:hypothetical protein